MISNNGRHSFPRIGIYSMTKHSLVAFTDTLRRELYNLGINVSSIEPGAFKTRLDSEENLVRMLSQTWDQSSDEVKESYGSPEQNKKIILSLAHLVPIEGNLDVCVDDMIDAIINCRPKIIYSPMNTSFKLFSIGLTYCPAEIIDWISNLFENHLLGKL